MNFFPVVSVHQHAQHREILDDIVKRFGFGAVYFRNKRKMAHYQPTNQEDSGLFLTALKPYLRVKQRQAALMSFIDAFRLMGLVVLGILPLILLMRRPAHAEESPAAPVD